MSQLLRPHSIFNKLSLLIGLFVFVGTNISASTYLVELDKIELLEYKNENLQSDNFELRFHCGTTLELTHCPTFFKTPFLNKLYSSNRLSVLILNNCNQRFTSQIAERIQFWKFVNTYQQSSYSLS